MKVLPRAIFLTIILSICASFSYAQNIVLRSPSPSPAASYVKEVLDLSYTMIGHNVTWLDSVANTELELASRGSLSGALARSVQIEAKFPDLVRVPYPIIKFALLKVNDRVRCGYCLTENLYSIAYVKGSLISENYINELPSGIKRFPLSSSKTLNQLLLKRRVDAMLLMDFQLDPSIFQQPNFLVEQLAEELDYHYLTPALAHLAEPLTMAFKKLEADGTLESLRQKYNINRHQELIIPTHKIKAVAGRWKEYAHSDGSGVYWNIVKETLTPKFNIDTQALKWEQAVNQFESGKVDILVGSYMDKLSDSYLYSNYHIDFEYPLYAFSYQQEVLTRFEAKDVKLSACVVAGSQRKQYVQFLPPENVFITTAIQCGNLLRDGKVDVFLEYDYNLPKTLKALPRKEVLPASPLFLVFQNTPNGRYLKQYFDSTIKSLAKSKQLAPLYIKDDYFQQANIRH